MKTLNRIVQCIHCWNQFPPGEILWVSEHEDLKGDLKVRDAAIRFIPSRFSPSGKALDAMGQECHQLACPHCHLTLPSSVVERDISFISLLGCPHSGKSYYLAAMLHQLRRRLAKKFNLLVNDADLVSNTVINRYERELFFQSDPDQPQALGELIPKTQLGGMLYNTVYFGSQPVNYPQPFVFNLDRMDEFDLGTSKQRPCSLCFYDNAGEHFEAGRDNNREPGTRHMSSADFLLFLYDPTQDNRWLAQFNGEAPPLTFDGMNQSQEHVLLEAGKRIRELKGMNDGARLDKPLMVLIGKFDVLLPLFPDTEWPFPLRASADRTVFDMSEFLRQSALVRDRLTDVVPTLVHAAESLSNAVFYVPVSSIGTRPTQFDDLDQPLIEPKRIKPWRADLPVLAGLAMTKPELIPSVRQ